MSALAYLSLGSNLGRREENVLTAARRLEAEALGEAVCISSLYETEPQDCEPMPDFINAVVKLRPLHDPEDLLKRLQNLEKRLGRSGGRNAPRPLDIDIIAYGDLRMRAEHLTVPHPRYRSRRFVLIPLREVAPEFRCPETRRTIDDLLDGAPEDPAVTRISARGLVPVTPP